MSMVQLSRVPSHRVQGHDRQLGFHFAETPYAKVRKRDGLCIDILWTWEPSSDRHYVWLGMDRRYIGGPG